MKANSHIKFTNILNLIQLYLDSIDLPKILVDRENTGNRKLQKTQLDRVAFALRNRRHRSINWRWQSRLMQWI